MKSIITKITPAATFPKYMQDVHTGSVYAMTSRCEGTLLAHGENSPRRHPVCHHKKTWVASTFVDFHGSLTLSCGCHGK